ncbi:MAG: SDR family NAD(P)-dependent oxidoreductase [Planctomycetota bacterium]|nr:SDR family NAD(P)-dependent oxidoreductase [Planctomycetota bacterium]
MQDTDKRPRPVVFITGASSGIGAAAVPLFAAAGYDVVLAARRKERLDKVAADAARDCRPAQCVPVVCDVDSDASVAAAFQAVTARFGRLDALINNAGFGVYGGVEQTAIETFRANLETNFLGVVRCTKAALPLLRAAVRDPLVKSGRCSAAIVMVSSFVGRRALPFMGAYCAGKFALEALSESLRIELWDERIAVSVVNPGVTQTEFFSSAHGVRPKTYIHPATGMTAPSVARALLRAVRRPRRNRYLTFAGRGGVLLQWLAPNVFDRALVQIRRRTGKA